MKRYGRLAAAFGAAALLLAGCGQKVPDRIEETTLVINSKGNVTAYMVGEFDKSYYSLSELEVMVREEAARFCGSAKKSEAVKVEKVSAAQDGGSGIVVECSFDGTDSYQDFMRKDETLFYGTVAEAIQQGYGGVTMYDAENGTAALWTEAAGELGKHVVIYCPGGQTEGESEETGLAIYCPYKAEYVSEGAGVQKDGSVEMIWTAENVSQPLYILLKK